MLGKSFAVRFSGGLACLYALSYLEQKDENELHRSVRKLRTAHACSFKDSKAPVIP